MRKLQPELSNWHTDCVPQPTLPSQVKRAKLNASKCPCPSAPSAPSGKQPETISPHALMTAHPYRGRRKGSLFAAVNGRDVGTVIMYPIYRTMRLLRQRKCGELVTNLFDILQVCTMCR